jgi:hypothetical protein
VRARFDAVETPLKRTKKSQNARKKFFLFSIAKGEKNLLNKKNRPSHLI